MKTKLSTVLRYAAEEKNFVILKGSVWSDCPLDPAARRRHGGGSHRIGGTIQKPVLMDGVNSCANF